MKLKWPVTLVGILGLLAAIFVQQGFLGLQAQNQLPTTLQKGFSYAEYNVGLYTNQTADDTIAGVKDAGANVVSILATVFQDSIETTTIYKGGTTPTDVEVRHIIQDAHDAGLEVNLKVHIDLLYDTNYDGGNDWRGKIGVDFTAQEWQDWFASYTTIMTAYADLAEEEGVEYFTVGTEIEKTVVHEVLWETLIADIDGRFSGELMYAANHGNENNVTFWDSMDYMGIDAYYPLNVSDTPTVADIKAAWDDYTTSMTNLHNNWQKPIILTEIGYRSVNGSTALPYCYWCTGPVDLQEQADAFQALFEVFSTKPWFAGMYIWEFDVVKSGSCDDGYSPYDKPAENVIRSWYGASSRSLSNETCTEVAATPTPNVTATPVPPPPPAGLGTGVMTREFWLQTADGTDMSVLTTDPRFPDNPTDTTFPTKMEIPAGFSDYYGTRLSGYIHAPETGEYVFAIEGDDQGEFWLSSDDQSTNVAMIANAPGWSYSYEWTKYPEQMSTSVSLVQGEKYYFEARHYDRAGGDHMSVGWSGPSWGLQLITGEHTSHNDTVAMVPPTPTPTPDPDAPPTPVPADSFPYKGFGYAKYNQGEYASLPSDEALEKMADTGANWISILVTWYQDNIDSTSIAPTGKTPTDADLEHVIDKAQSLGINVLLKPHLDLEYDGTHWRGQIGSNFDNATWATWFESYGDFIGYYADLAELHDVEMFSVGTETEKAAVREAQFEAVIADVRTRYSGDLTYAANHGNEQNIQFWDKLDLIGLDAYYNLTTKDDPTLQELKNAWTAPFISLESLADFWDKDIIFTEIGYRSVDGANKTPWCEEARCPGLIDLDEQVDTYEALLETFHAEPWFGGLFAWAWDTDPNKSGECDQGYSPYNKPVENVLRAWFGAAERPEILSACANAPTATPTPTATPQITPPPPPAPGSGATGTILRQWFDDIVSTNSMTDLTNDPDFPDSPVENTMLTSFSIPSQFGDYYGSRVTGYVYPPVTGEYTFSIIGDDKGELLLSTDSDPANVTSIASFDSWRSQAGWTEYPQQTSITITLQAGQQYYIEAHHIERTGGDALKVGWKGPGFSRQLIAGQYLSPYELNGGIAPTPAPTAVVIESTPVPPTAVPPTDVPPTDIPATTEPATAVPPTAVPATDVPATTEPATPAPATPVPATPVPATPVPATPVPATPVPAPTATMVPTNTSVPLPTVEPTNTVAAGQPTSTPAPVEPTNTSVPLPTATATAVPTATPIVPATVVPEATPVTCAAPIMSIGPATIGAPGSEFMLTGVCFGKNEVLTIEVNGEEMPVTVETDEEGTFEIAIVTASDLASGPYNLSIAQHAGITAEFVLSSAFALQPTLNADMELQLLGQGEPVSEATNTPAPEPPVTQETGRAMYLPFVSK